MVFSHAVEHLLIYSMTIFCMPTMCARRCVRDAANIVVEKFKHNPALGAVGKNSKVLSALKEMNR